MTTLTATAVITAVDRASAVFARVAASASALGGRFATAAGGVSKFGQSAMGTLGMPAAMAGGIAAAGEYQVDRLSRLMQAAGELNEQQRKMLTDTAFDVSALTGQSAQDVTKGQRELILGGLDASTAAQSSDLIAKVARSNDIAMEKVAEDAITNASALGLAMTTTEDKVASLRKTMDFMSTVPAFSPMNWEDLSTAMKYAGPVAGQLKIEMADLGAALSMLAFAGFKGESAGTAFRTIMTRLVAPTRQARIELRAAGVDLQDLYDLDLSHANDKGKLTNRLKEAGLLVESERAAIEKRLGKLDVSRFDGVSDYGDALQAFLMNALRIEKGDAQSREELRAAIGNHIMGAVSSVDIEKSFKALSKLGPRALKQMFGLNRYSEAKALINAIDKIIELPNGDRIGALTDLADKLEIAIPGAAERKAKAVMTGYASSVDRISAALGRMRHQIFESGFGASLTGAFQSLGASINELSQADPERLKKIGWALTALATAPVFGAAAAGAAALALALTDLSKVFEGGYAQTLGPNGGILTSSAPSPAGKLLSEVGGLANSFRDLFNVDPRTSALGTGLGGIAGLIESIAGGVRELREGLDGYKKTRTGKSIENPAFDAGADLGNWFKKKIFGEKWGDEYNNVGREGLSPLSLLPVADPVAWNDRRTGSMERFSFGAGMAPMLPQQQVHVNGSFKGHVDTVIEVKYVGPVQGPSRVTAGASIAGDLNSGESSMDFEGGQ